MSGRTVYTFGAATFWREGEEIVPWFYAEDQYTADVVLGSATTYVDIGAAAYPPLSFRASFASSAARQTLIGLRGTTGTLSNTRSKSDTATLVKATPVNQGNYGLWECDVTFVRSGA